MQADSSESVGGLLAADGDLAIPGARGRVLWPMALGIFTAILVVRAGCSEGALWDLNPYLDAPKAQGFFASQLSEFMTAWPRAIASALIALLAFLVFEACIRFVWRKPFEAPALLCATGFAVLPAHIAMQKLAGGFELQVGLVSLLAGLYCILLRPRTGPLVGALLCGLSCAVHPAFLALAPIPMGLWVLRWRTENRGRGWLAIPLGLMAVYAGFFWLGGGSVPAKALVPVIEVNRLEWAYELLAAAPALAPVSAVRALLPTGYEALTGDWPVAVGCLIWTLFFGWGLMVVGIRRASFAAIAVLSAGILAPLLTAHWLPGERALAMLPILPALGLMACFLSVIRGAVPRDVYIVLSVLLVAGTFYSSSRDEFSGRLESRATALTLPWAPLGEGHVAEVFAPVLEKDAARLVLFAHDMQRQETAKERESRIAQAQIARDYRLKSAQQAVSLSDRRLVVALDPERLRDLSLPLAGDTRGDALVAFKEERHLFKNLQELESLIARISSNARLGNPNDSYLADQHDLQAALGNAMEIVYAEPRTRRLQMFIQRFRKQVAKLSGQASSVGDLRFSIPLQEVHCQLMEGRPREAHARGVFALSLTDAKRFEEAEEHIEFAIPKLDEVSTLRAALRAAKARALLAEGKESEALDQLQTAWSGIGRAVRQQGPSAIASPNSVDYWRMLDLLMDRYLLTKKLDPPMEGQARRDVERFLRPDAPVGSVGKIPALIYRAEWTFASGDSDRALELLKESDAVRPEGLLQRAEFFDLPWIRLRGLRLWERILVERQEPAELRKLREKIEELENR